jgi:hypothetical protein
MVEKDELGRLWSSQTRGPQIEGEKMLEIVMREANRFDRVVNRRNWREWIAGGFVAVFFVFVALAAPNALVRAGAAVIAASGLWIILYLARYGREAADPTPDQTLLGFERALLRKYEHQIRLLKNVKYWYLLPPYIGLLLMSAGQILQHHRVAPLGWVDFIRPAIYTAFFAFVWWLNEMFAVGRLQEKRARLLERMRTGEEED